MTNRTKSPAFSLIELLAALTIVAVLVILGIGAGRQTLAGAQRSDSLARLRTFGQAVLTYAGEHDSQLPGPLWPGQVLLYDAAETGRAVVRLAPYLEVEHRDSPYLVDRLLPKAFSRNGTTGALDDLRVYVMNSSIVHDGQTNRPFGSLTVGPAVEPMRLGRLPTAPDGERWMMSETDRRHPDVAGAPWKASTPPEPLHDGFRASVNFDGSAALQKVP
jgi:type II secretory pathway pseudopilin PulG